MLHPDYPLKIIPVNFGVKFNPPKLGLEYTLLDQPQIQQIYEIALQPLLDRHIPIDDMVSQLFKEHKYYLHPKVIAEKQVRKLIERVLQRKKVAMDKENSSAFNQNSSGAPAHKQANNNQSLKNNWLHEQQDNSRDQLGGLSDKDDQTDNSVVINSSAMDDLDIQIKQGQEGGLGKQNFNLAGGMAGMGGIQLESNSQEQSLNMPGQSDDDMQGAESDYLNGGASNQFLQNGADQDEEYGDELGDDQLAGQDQMLEDEEDADVIDIENPADLARRGLKRIECENEHGELVEYLLDREGNLFDLQGDYQGQTDQFDEF